jgi:hypothetical protein
MPFLVIIFNDFSFLSELWRIFDFKTSDKKVKKSLNRLKLVQISSNKIK